MKNKVGLTALGILLGLTVTKAEAPAFKGSDSPETGLSICIIYDNYQVDKRLDTDWGFACLVETGVQKLLFDAGRNASLFQKNVELLGINPEEIPTLFISHEHGDHTAGISWITEVNPSIKCYLPSAYAAQLKASGTLPPNSKKIEKPGHMYGPFYSTGDRFEAFKEQGLIVKTEKGGVLITGCGHPGPIEMIKTAKDELGIDIYALIGGLHLMRKSEEQMEKIADSLKELGVELICPTHCTGDKAIAFLAESFGKAYISGGTGQVITIK